jgi:glycosyltransferase involved in cell wall biosynthesis
MQKIIRRLVTSAMNIKISVIIPLLNKGPYVGRAVKSVLHQTFQNFEIIVIDGGSEDNGPEIIKEFSDPRIHFLEQTGKGVSNARNEAVNSAENNYIAFLDADDEWMPKYLETIYHLTEKFPEAGIFTTAWKIHAASGTIRWAKYEHVPKPPWEGLLPDYFKSAALGDSPVWTSVAVVPTKIFHETGGFDERHWYGEDTDLFGRIALKYPVAFSWEFGAVYHLDALNRAGNRQVPLDTEEPFVSTARKALLKGDVAPEFIGSVNEYISYREIVRAVSNVRSGNSKNAQIILKKCRTRWHYLLKIKWTILAKIPYPVFVFLGKIKLKYRKLS